MRFLPRTSSFRAICLALFVMALAASASAKTNIAHLHWSGYGEAFLDHARAMADEFERRNPGVEISFEVSSGDMMEYLMVRIASGVQLDSFSVMPHWGLITAIDGIAADLTPYLDREGPSLRDNFLPGTLETYMYGDIIWGLPDSVIIQALGYNATLFDEAALQTPAELGQSQWTWDALKSAAEKLTRDLSGDGVPDVFGYEFGAGSPRMIDIAPVVDQAGGLMFDRRVDPTEATYTTPEVRNAVAWIMDFFHRGLSPQASLDQPGFRERAAAMVSYEQPRELGWFENDDEIRLYHHPRGPVQGGTHLITRGLQVHAASEHPDLAYQWIKFLATSDIAQDSYIRRTNWLPAWAPSLALWQEVAKVPAGMANPIPEILSNQDNRGRYLTRVSQTERIVQEYLVQVVQNEIPLETALEEAQRETNVLLKEAHAR